MTYNQIAYQKHLEEMRANQAQESLTNLRDSEQARANRASEQLNRERNQETNRSNLAQEEIKRSQNAETQRANLVREAQNQSALNETARTNLANELLQADRNVIQRQQLAETSRSNRENEDIKHAANANNLVVAQMGNESRERIAEKDRKAAMDRTVFSESAASVRAAKHETAETLRQGVRETSALGKSLIDAASRIITGGLKNVKNINIK